jgi:hypothetical protein
MLAPKESRNSLKEVLKLFCIFIILIIAYRLITTQIDERCTYNSIKTFCQVNENILNDIEIYLKQNYKDSLNTHRSDSSVDWHFVTTKRRLKMASVYNKGYNTFDLFIDSCLTELRFETVDYSTNGSISYSSLDFHEFSLQIVFI